MSSSFTARALQPQLTSMASTICPAPARVCGHGASLAGHAINSSLGRLVVLTIRRLVASNSTCCASLLESSHSLIETRWPDAWTIPLEAETIPPAGKIQGLSRRMFNQVFSLQHSVAFQRHRDVCGSAHASIPASSDPSSASDQVRLIVTDFKHDPTGGRNHVRYPLRQAAVHREPVRAAVKSFDRIEIADLRLKTVEIPPFAHKEDLQSTYGRARRRFQVRPRAATPPAVPGRGGGR